MKQYRRNQTTIMRTEEHRGSKKYKSKNSHEIEVQDMESNSRLSPNFAVLHEVPVTFENEMVTNNPGSGSKVSDGGMKRQGISQALWVKRMTSKPCFWILYSK